MEDIDFYDRFNLILENVREQYAFETIHDAFIAWFFENSFFTDMEDLKERIVEDRHAEGIDAIVVDSKSFNIYFVSAKTNAFSGVKNNFGENDIKLTLSGFRFLVRGNYKGKITPELEDLIDEYHELIQNGGYKTWVLFLYMKDDPIDYKFVEDFKKEFDNKVEVKFVNFKALKEYYENDYLPKIASPPENISFRIITNYLTKNSPRNSAVFTCKGNELAKIYNDNKERIFQQNVRLSLGIRSKSINKQIYETAVDEKRRRDFWYFNNGITIICSELDIATNGKVANLKRAQIINGAQTTYSLYDAYKSGKLDDSVEILIKAIETNEREFIDNVTLYTNSQNAIRLRDLCSNDEIQIRIQKEIIGCYKYFYERKRGEFDSLYKTHKAKVDAFGGNYKKRQMSNEKAAQGFLALYLNKPSQAKSEKARIFIKDSSGFYDQIFNPKNPLITEKILLSSKLLQYVENEKKKYRKQMIKAESLSEEEKRKVYRQASTLHSEYFVVDILNDFLNHSDLNTMTRDGILSIINAIDENSATLAKLYAQIKEETTNYTDELQKTQEGYYHAKFFKSEKSIGLLRNYLRTKYPFVSS